MSKRRFLFQRIFPAAAASFLILYYGLLVFSANPKLIQADIVRSLETETEGTFHDTQFSLSYFPVLQMEFKGAELQAVRPSPFNFKAKRIKVRFSFWAFVFGKAEISNIAIEGGEIHRPLSSPPVTESLDITHMRLRVQWNEGRKQAVVQGAGDLEGTAHALSGSGTIGNLDFKNGHWRQIFFDGNIFLKSFPVTSFQYDFLKKRDVLLKQGNLSGQAHLHKDREDLWAHVQGKGALTGLFYEVQDDVNRLMSPAINLQIETEMEWNRAEKILAVNRAAFISPHGKLQAGGKIFLPAKEFRDMRITLSEFALESIPQYYLPFKETVPFNVGFSGRSELEMSLQGTPDQLSIHANWDLSPALLTYAGYFSKPKDMPLNIISDCVLKDGKVLSGDFSLKIQDAGIKGALAHLNLQTGEGQLNLLTNKFKLESWAALLPPFQGYHLEGDMKILVNFEGNLLQRPRGLKTLANLTLENVRIARGNAALSNIFLALDYSPLSLEIKEAQVQAGEQPLVFSLMVYDPLVQPKAKMNLRSEKLDAVKLLKAVETVGQEVLSKPLKIFIAQARQAAEEFVPQGQTVDQLAAELEMKDNKLWIQKLQFQLYDGTMLAKGRWGLTSQDASYQMSAEIDRLNLARFFSRNQKERQLVHGNFFLKGDFEGKSLESQNWRDSLTGKGAVSITNGEFNTFSLSKAVADIQGFSILSALVSDSTRFDDLQADFEIASGKAVFEKMTILSPDFKAFADGEISLEGFLNYRLNVFLPSESAKEILGSMLDASKEPGGESFGPIPLLLSGTLDRPEVKADPSKLAEFKDQLSHKKVHKVLRTFLPEETLLKRFKSS